MDRLLPLFAHMGELPIIIDHEEFYATRSDEALYLPAIQEICRRHDLSTDNLSKYPGGGMIVFAIGQGHVIKLYAPFWPHHYKVEIASHKCIYDKLGVDTPQVIATGQLEGWPYLVMSQLKGEPFFPLWLNLDKISCLD